MMAMTRILFSILLLLPLLTNAQQISIIPRPEKIVMNADKTPFIIGDRLQIVVLGTGHENSYFFLNEYLQKYYDVQTVVFMDTPNIKGAVYLNYERMDNRLPGAYTLEVKKDGIHINGDNEMGVFYGIQTLIQLLPVEKSAKLSIPAVTVTDRPRFGYRGLHLDVGRHFMPVSFIKKYLDYIALHKLNYFHWHLTDDQGWRIEIKKYPRLTTVGSKRNGTIIGRYPGNGNDNQVHEGFYTQDEVREVLDYAAKRYITVVPEIELPGHASAAIAAYPFLSCFPNEKTKIPANMISNATADAQSRGEKKFVQETWGVFDDVFCAGSDSTFGFLQDVLDEVAALFPSKYIHIGGDECPKSNWKRCPKCQQRIKQNNLKNEHQLQSYVIRRMDEYLNKKGKTIIGWDEILEGGLAPNAIVMSWRGEQGGIEAARQKHPVIMTPGNYVYFDHSQTKYEDSVTIGSFTPIEEVYSYEPAAKALTPEQAKYIIGAQANVWTEYMKNPAKVEYMVFPRLAALSEVLWSPKNAKSWPDFEKRLKTQFARYGLWNINYSRAYKNLSVAILPAAGNNGLLLKVVARNPAEKIVGVEHHANGHSEEQLITGTGSVSKVITNSASYNFTSVYGGDTNYVLQKIRFAQSTGKKIVLTNPPAQNFPGEGGAFGLVNGVVSEKGQNSTEWLGWQGKDLEAIVDLGRNRSIKEVITHVLTARGSQPCKPQWMEVLVSANGTSYKTVGKTTEVINDSLNMGRLYLSFPAATARFVKIRVKNFGTIPDGMPGAGNEAWLYADEIQVN
jgi:hexosaminidase